MPNFIKVAALLLGLFLLLPVVVNPPVFAQSTDISSSYTIADSGAQEADILISTSDRGIVRATIPYDNKLFGVLQNQPLMVFRRADNTGKPVARFSTAEVNVTTLNGPITTGDYITSSEIAGKGMKGTLSGYVIGVALAPLDEKSGSQIDFQPKDPSEPVKKITSGKIPVALKIEFAELSGARPPSRLFDSVNTALFANVKDPSKVAEIFRYVAAGAIVLASFAFGFFTFSRSVPKAIEAIGRNPLAEKAILFSVIINIFFTIITAAVGIFAAVLILRL
ncbi:hypothetical protein A2874_02200 [Candidatus Daviesbacteria bacterium RIFCSPHIGHO2_01_FULL_43_17]|nr:MAG: hypothetical protein A2874_02200 [Candidatus Daviesbacteria bacterium RIFCSPHIGHO2_01_FULL_43_17]